MGIEDKVAGTAFAAVLGGTLTEMGGGKFANGALTGAFQYIFNHCAHNDCWGRPETLQDHFDRHGSDFGSKSPAEYAKQAQEFQTRALNDMRSEFRIDADGTLRIYDPATNTFAAYNEDGSTKTFYKPRRGESYWNGATRDADWGQKVDVTKPANMSRVLRGIRTWGRNLE